MMDGSGIYGLLPSMTQKAGGKEMASRIIGGKRYALEKRNLLCETVIRDPDKLIDFRSKTMSLYYPKGKIFIVDVVHDMTGLHEPPRIITRDEAMKIMDEHPEDIKEDVYVRYFGEPEEV